MEEVENTKVIFREFIDKANQLCEASKKVVSTHGVLDKHVELIRADEEFQKLFDEMDEVSKKVEDCIG